MTTIRWQSCMTKPMSCSTTTMVVPAALTRRMSRAMWARSSTGVPAPAAPPRPPRRPDETAPEPDLTAGGAAAHHVLEHRRLAVEHRRLEGPHHSHPYQVVRGHAGKPPPLEVDLPRRGVELAP